MRQRFGNRNASIFTNFLFLLYSKFDDNWIYWILFGELLLDIGIFYTSRNHEIFSKYLFALLSPKAQGFISKILIPNVRYLYLLLVLLEQPFNYITWKIPQKIYKMVHIW